MLIFLFYKYRRSQPLKSLASRFRGGAARGQPAPLDHSSFAISPVSEKPLISPIPAAFPAPVRRNTEPAPQAHHPPSRGGHLAPIGAGGRPHAAGAAAHRRSSVSSAGASSVASSAALSPSTMSWPMPPQTPAQSTTGGSNSRGYNPHSGAGNAANSAGPRGNNSSGGINSSSPQWITFHEPATTVVRVEHRRPTRLRR